MPVTVSVYGVDRVQARLNGMARRAVTPGPTLWEQVGHQLRQEYAAQFRTQGVHFLNRPWAPLSPKTLAWKGRYGYARRGILVQTGGMRSAFTERGRMAIVPPAGTTVEFITRHHLAPFHQYGTHRHGRRHIPPRPIVVATHGLAQNIAKIVSDYIVGNDTSTGVPGGDEGEE